MSSKKQAAFSLPRNRRARAPTNIPIVGLGSTPELPVLVRRARRPARLQFPFEGSRNGFGGSPPPSVADPRLSAQRLAAASGGAHARHPRTANRLVGKGDLMLIDPAQLERDYFERKPDLDDPGQLVSFGTSGHRGSPLRGSFTEAHILAIALGRISGAVGIPKIVCISATRSGTEGRRSLTSAVTSSRLK